LPNKKSYLTYSPLGVIGIISPWNFPLNTPFSEIALALMAGNSVILKPSEVTGNVNLLMQSIIDAMQLPEGVFQMIHGKGGVGAALAAAYVDRIIFTGSTATGKKVMASATPNLTPLTLELGGKDCMIVFEDADLDVATSAALAGGFYNSGQACCSIERLLLHESIATQFTEMLTNKAAKLRQSESTGFGNDIGPVTFEGQKKVYHEQAQDLIQKGGKVLFGNSQYDGEKNFHPLLINVELFPFHHLFCRSAKLYHFSGKILYSVFSDSFPQCCTASDIPVFNVFCSVVPSVLFSVDCVSSFVDEIQHGKASFSI
jgi:acyl-CoA reductase-like NAD-dependent aldehyde dehydrogenase